MNASTEVKEFRLDGLKWLFVALLVVGGAIANSYYSNEIALLYRFIAMIVLGGFAAFIAVNTKKGSQFWQLLRSAQVELKKVVWPSRQESTQTTLIVLVVVVIAAIILWGLDTGLGFLASKIIG